MIKSKKIISMMLALIMLASSLPIQVFAENDGQKTAENAEGNNEAGSWGKGTGKTFGISNAIAGSGYRIYIVDQKTGQQVSNTVDFVDKDPNQYSYYAKQGMYDHFRQYIGTKFNEEVLSGAHVVAKLEIDKPYDNINYARMLMSTIQANTDLTGTWPSYIPDVTVKPKSYGESFKKWFYANDTSYSGFDYGSISIGDTRTPVQQTGEISGTPVVAPVDRPVTPAKPAEQDNSATVKQIYYDSFMHDIDVKMIAFVNLYMSSYTKETVSSKIKYEIRQHCDASLLLLKQMEPDNYETKEKIIKAARDEALAQVDARVSKYEWPTASQIEAYMDFQNDIHGIFSTKHAGTMSSQELVNEINQLKTVINSSNLITSKQREDLNALITSLRKGLNSAGAYNPSNNSLFMLAYADGTKSNTDADVLNMTKILDYKYNNKTEWLFKFTSGVKVTKSVAWTIAENHYTVMVEPILWFNAQGYSSGGAYYMGYDFYGTPSNYGYAHKIGEIKDGTIYAGNWGQLVNRAAAKGMWIRNDLLKSDFEIKDNKIEYKDSSAPVLMYAPTAKLNTDERLVSDTEMGRLDLGWSIQAYYYQAGGASEAIQSTSLAMTLGGSRRQDYYTPHPAPNPERSVFTSIFKNDTDLAGSDIGITSDEAFNPENHLGKGWGELVTLDESVRKLFEDEIAKWTYDIVKVYDIEHMDGSIETEVVYVRTKNPGRILMENETDYKVIDSFTTTKNLFSKTSGGRFSYSTEDYPLNLDGGRYWNTEITSYKINGDYKDITWQNIKDAFTGDERHNETWVDYKDVKDTKYGWFAYSNNGTSSSESYNLPSFGSERTLGAAGETSYATVLIGNYSVNGVTLNESGKDKVTLANSPSDPDYHDTTLYVHLRKKDFGPPTHTWNDPDPNDGNDEGPGLAPDPATDPRDPERYPNIPEGDPSRKYRIVKIYQWIDPYTGVIYPWTSNTRYTTLGNVDIENEGTGENAWKVKAWKLSNQCNPTIAGNGEHYGLTWNHVYITSLPIIKEQEYDDSVAEMQVIEQVHMMENTDGSISDEERTLYVLLQRELNIIVLEEFNPRLVEVYQNKDTRTGIIEHIETTVEKPIAPLYKIDDKGNYKVIEWKFSRDYNDVTTDTNWDDPKISTVNVIGSGSSKTAQPISIVDPNDSRVETTLYVLYRSEVKSVLPVNDDLTESQLTKISNTNVSFGWNSNSIFTASITTNSHNHDHCTCSDCDCDGCSCSCTHSYSGLSAHDPAVHVTFNISQKSDLESSKEFSSVFCGKMWGNGQNPSTSGITFKDNVEGSKNWTLSSDGSAVDGIEYITTIGRNSTPINDKVTIASYKITDKSTNNTSYRYIKELFPTGNTPQKVRLNNSNGNPISKTVSLSFGHTSDEDKNVYDYCSKSSLHDAWSVVPAAGTNAPNGVTLTSNSWSGTGTFKVWVYQGKKDKDTDVSATIQANGFPVLHVNKSTTNSSLFHSKQTAKISFYPYIKMSYMITDDSVGFEDYGGFAGYVKNPSQANTRTAYMLSTKKSTITPTNAVEVSWNNETQKKEAETNLYSLQMTSQQWSTHKLATTGEDWRQKTQVLPGGALYQLSTKGGEETTVKTVTYNTLVENNDRNEWINVTDANKYTIPSIIKSTSDFLKESENVLENYRVVQWVNKDWTAKNAWDNAESQAVKIKDGGESLNNLGLNNQKASSDSKYRLINGTDTNKDAHEADIDIVSKQYYTTVYKGFTDVDGNVRIYWVTITSGREYLSEADLTTAVKYLENVCGTNMTSSVALPSNMKPGNTGVIGNKRTSLATMIETLKNNHNDIYMMELKTGWFSNLVNSVERNTGNDVNATWTPFKDGKWYNEAFDGYYMVAQTALYTVGLNIPNKRIAVLDPNLCPSVSSKGGIFTNAYVSQFRIDEKSTVAMDKPDGYYGTFEDMTVIMPNLPMMYYTRPFYIPNATVQDIQ